MAFFLSQDKGVVFEDEIYTTADDEHPWASASSFLSLRHISVSVVVVLEVFLWVGLKQYKIRGEGDRFSDGKVRICFTDKETRIIEPAISFRFSL